MYGVSRHYSKKRLRRFILRVFLVSFIFFVLFNVFLTDRLYGRDSNTDVSVEPQKKNSAPEFNDIAKPAVSRGVTDEENIMLWGYTGGVDSYVEKHLPRKYWGPIMRLDNEGTVDEWTTTNLSCNRLREIGVSEEEMRRRYISHRAVREATGCDTLSVPFNPLHDAQCIEFMTNPSFWKSLVPISQSEDERTIKFSLTIHSVKSGEGALLDYPIKTIIKVPQRFSYHEPMSEVAAFHADRILQINRVPPTGWACLPVYMIKEAVEKYKNSVKTVPEFLHQSRVSNYAEWVKKDLFDFVRTTDVFEQNVSSGESCIRVSIQLKVADVGHLLSSPLRIPYSSHKDTWHDFFDLNANENEVRNFLANLRLAGVFHLSEINMFDYVIGNMDRSPNKNNFVVGGVHLRKKTGSFAMLHPNHPTFIYLDHGLAFFRRRPRRNAITVSMKAFEKGRRDTFCLFRGPLLRRIRELDQTIGGDNRQTIFTMRMKQNLPKGVFGLIGEPSIWHCASRIREILAMAERCLENELIRPYVLFP